jgi:hypothetical protein
VSIATQWVNTEPDEGAPHALLERVARHIPPDTIDEIWLFPTRRAGGVESTVFVITAYGDDPERRRVATAHFSVTRDRLGRPRVTERLEEHALAPAAALRRVVDGVLRRLGDEIARAPRAERIDRDLARWNDLLTDLGAPPGSTGENEEQTRYDGPGREAGSGQ